MSKYTRGISADPERRSVQANSLMNALAACIMFYCNT